MIVLDVLTVILLLIGAAFYLGGTVGLLRFPDTLTRLHAPSKADNLGLGFVVAGLALQADSLAVVAKLLLVWLFTLLLAGSSAYLIGRQATKPREPR